jgi:hypothetical protein
VKRRIFIKMSAAGIAYAAVGPAVPYWPMDTLPATPIPEEGVLAGFPLKVRPFGPDGPLTDWIHTFNNAHKLVIEQMPPCKIVGIEISVTFPEMDWTIEQVVPMPATVFIEEQQDVTFWWAQPGIIDPSIDAI